MLSDEKSKRWMLLGYKKHRELLLSTKNLDLVKC